MTDRAWQAIFEHYQIDNHDFDTAPYYLSANDIKRQPNNLRRLENVKPVFYANKIHARVALNYSSN